MPQPPTSLGTPPRNNSSDGPTLLHLNPQQPNDLPATSRRSQTDATMSQPASVEGLLAVEEADEGGASSDDEDDDEDDDADGEERADDDDDDDDDTDDDTDDDRDMLRRSRTGNPTIRWRPIIEDKSEPCKDEIEYIESKVEHSALDRDYWEQKIFFDLADPEIRPEESGRIDWLVSKFNGSEDAQNNEYIMRSDTIRIGGFDWRIKFFPRGDDTDFLSIYVECVTMQGDDFEEYETRETLPFPQLEGRSDPPLRKRCSIAAQVGVVMYNPAEPRVYYHNADAHQYHKSSADFGWRYFTRDPRSDFHFRQHGQRQAILRNDKLAFSAYIRIVQDPTECQWEPLSVRRSFENSVIATGLRPFAFQGAQLIALVPLFHFIGSRNLIRASQSTDPTLRDLQTILFKMYTRCKSPSYGRRCERDLNDAISVLRSVARILKQEYGDEAVNEIIGSFHSTQKSCTGSSKLAIRGVKSIQAAINLCKSPIETPQLLTLELGRQEFNRKKRTWQRIVDQVMLDEHIVVGGRQYTLFAFGTHSGSLTSNKHRAYVRPGGLGSRWFAYEDCSVTAVTSQVALHTHAGFKVAEPSEAAFGDLRQIHERIEVAYVVHYVRDDVAASAFALPKTEKFDYKPNLDGDANDKGFPLAKEAKETTSGSVGDGDLEMPDLENGSATPLPSTGDDKDIVMSSDDDASWSADSLVASTRHINDQTTCTGAPGNLSEIIVDALGQDFYRGQMYNNKRHGKGHWISMGGDEYQGNFEAGQPHGQGNMTYGTTGNVYEGSWENGERHGDGRLTEAATGNVYVGGWKNDRKHGKFVLQGVVTEEDRSHCTICFENAITTAFYDCGHVVACKDCANQVEDCPVCRRRIVSRLQLYGVKMTLA